ncbi:MAG: tRNA threonylcarbamoyladenosine biosynthesis protein TsaE [Rhodothermales bacterium]|jgi:tRNA threonylcarbamoyladenosine biosynthesis protein TsaE
MSLITTHSDTETVAVGSEFAAGLRGGDIVALHGDLGAGKTVFARGVARGLGIADPVTSPTFTVVQEYEGPELRLYHIDLYRLQGEEDAIAFGIEEFLNDPEAVTLLEWAERIAGLLPKEHLSVQIESPTAETRTLAISPSSR